MPSLTSFSISQHLAVGGGYEWRLKDLELRYRGTGEYEHLVRKRIPASREQVETFAAALELLEVWNWRSDYTLEDLDFDVMDGSSWAFAAKDGDRSWRSGGANAYPSYESAERASPNPARFGLLLAALHDAFSIERHIRQARLSAEGQGRPHDRS